MTSVLNSDSATSYSLIFFETSLVLHTAYFLRKLSRMEKFEYSRFSNQTNIGQIFQSSHIQNRIFTIICFYFLAKVSCTFLNTPNI